MGVVGAERIQIRIHGGTLLAKQGGGAKKEFILLKLHLQCVSTKTNLAHRNSLPEMQKCLFVD